jgi:hypothetical protein
MNSAPSVGCTGRYPICHLRSICLSSGLMGLECIRVLAELAHTGRFNYTSDCAHGLTLKDWVPAEEFSVMLDRCSERSIEIFWKTYFG